MRFKNIILHIVFVATTILFAVSCLKDNVDRSMQEREVPISIVTRDVNDGASNIDERVTSLRMMVFAGTGGTAVLEYNILENLSIGTSQFSHSIITGTRTIVFVANETPAVATQLHAVTRLNDLYSVNFSSTAFNGSDAIPMYARYDNVVITKDNGTGKAIISGGGVMEANAWKIDLEKLAIKLNLTLTSEDDITAKFSGVTFSNLPGYVPLIPNVMYNNSTTAGSNVSLLSTDFDISYSAVTGWKAISKATTRIILPSKVFASENQDSDKSHAVVLTANMSASYSPSGPIGFAMPINYSLPRNNNYFVTAQVEFPMPVNVDVQPWSTESIDTGVGRSLQLSAVNVNITERKQARVTFTSNQRHVYVDPLSPNIDDFDGIKQAGNSRNLHYTYDPATGFGSGYIDIYSATLTSDKTSKIILVADGDGASANVGLRREITVNFKKTDLAGATYNDFVGAFWRGDQRGERVIYNPNTIASSWKAEVDDPTGTGSFVVLSTSFSYDPSLFTDNATDGEIYLVTDGVTSVTGSGRMYFRIGLTGFGSATTPRYARVKVTPNILQPATFRYIYIRQGEADDYVMRPSEPSTTLAVRNYAVKFSPYNITAPVMGTGGALVANHPTLDVRGGAFTNFPSQAGAFMSWTNSNANNARKAYHPLNASTALGNWTFANTIISIPGSEPYQYWGQSYDYNTCPAGYRRPENGDIYNPVTASDPNSSEILQSLWSNPVALGNTDNSVYGYLADGYFDRRLPVVSLNNAELSAVSATNKDVGYVGRLFYNPSTNASLFFPLSGSRNNADGSLAGVGLNGSYWTGSASTVTNAWNFQLGKSSATINNATSRGFGFNIRCVADNGLRVYSFSDNTSYGAGGVTAEKQMFLTDRLVNYGSHGTYSGIDNIRYFYNPYGGVIGLTYAQIANFEGLLIIAYPIYLNISDTDMDRIADRIISGKLSLIYQIDGAPGADPVYNADIRIMARLLGKSAATYSQIFNVNRTVATTNNFPITVNTQDHPIMNGVFGGIAYGSLIYKQGPGTDYPIAMAAGVSESTYPDMVVLARRTLTGTGSPSGDIEIAVHKKYPFMMMRNGCTLGENETYNPIVANRTLLRPLWKNFAVWASEYRKSMGM